MEESQEYKTFITYIEPGTGTKASREGHGTSRKQEVFARLSCCLPQKVIASKFGNRRRTKDLVLFSVDRRQSHTIDQRLDIYHNPNKIRHCRRG